VTAERIDRKRAEALAYEVLDLFDGTCNRVMIGGSIRRLKPDVKDIEIILEPKIEAGGVDLFGDATDAINRQFVRAKELRAAGVFLDRLSIDDKAAFGERFQRVLYKGIPLDIFCCVPPAQWGVIATIRTGSGDFNKRIVRKWAEGGTVLRVGMEIRDGQLWDQGKVIPTPTEESFFEAIGLQWIAPERRDA